MEFGLVELLSPVEVTRKSGVLSTRGQAGRADLSFRDGRFRPLANCPNLSGWANCCPSVAASLPSEPSLARLLGLGGFTLPHKGQVGDRISPGYYAVTRGAN